jgi:lysophospholipase L1-like esterase
MKHRLILTIIIAFSVISWSDPLPRFFLIGDSISIHYTPYLKQYLSGIVQLDRKEDDGQAEKDLDVPAGANGGDSRMVLAYLKSKIKESGFHPDYLLLNCGLHDIKRDPSTGDIQVKERDYRKNLNEIFRLLEQNKIRSVWIKTTWVVDSIHNARSKNFKRFEADVQRYNTITDSICNKRNIPVIDLYHFSKQLGVGNLTDHVHYKEPARALQGAYIAGCIQAIIDGRKR